METQTTFDLNLAVRRWREDLAHSSAFRNENLNELESHLRDSIDRLRARELSDEEAFLIATRRVGNIRRLEQEFGKVNTAGIWFDRCLWVLLAVQLWSLISSGSSLLLSIVAPAVLWINEILPGFGLNKIDTNWVQSSLALGFSPLPTAIATALVWRYFIWPKRRGSALLQRLLQRPATLTISLFLLCIIAYAAAAWTTQAWYYPLLHYPSLPALQIRIFLFRLPSLTLWAALTFFAARKRLRTSLR